MATTNESVKRIESLIEHTKAEIHDLECELAHITMHKVNLPTE